MAQTEPDRPAPAGGLPDLAGVLTQTDPGARNYAITRTYHALSEALADLLGRRDTTWPTFGVWASATAGRIIRGEEIAFPATRRAVADGNRAIIADIGPRLARFVVLARQARAGGSGAWEELVPRVAADPLLTETPILADAFAAYADVAMLRAGDRDRAAAQAMLRANVLVAHHEQALADAYVDRAIPLGGIAGILATRWVRLRIPDGALDVCRDVPAPAYLHGEPWPAVLDRLDDPLLAALATRYDQDADDASRSDAWSWEDLDERMGYIFCFFRAYQRDPALFALPPGVPPEGPGAA